MSQPWFTLSRAELDRHTSPCVSKEKQETKARLIEHRRLDHSAMQHRPGPPQLALTSRHPAKDGSMAAPSLSSPDSSDYPRPLALSGTTDAETATRMSAANPDYPRPLTDRLEDVVETWAQSHYELVTLAAGFADSPEWILTGSPTAAHWLAAIADVEPCTAREWIRIGRLLQNLPATADAFKTRQISYSKVRTLTRLATPENEHELLHIATTTTAANLGRALAAWLHRNTEPEDLAEYHHQQRSARWRTEPDGMTTFTLRLPPLLAGILISVLTTWIMTTRPKPDTSGEWPSVAQQHTDAIEALLTEGPGSVDTEVVVHVRGDGNTLDDGTPIPDSVVADLIPESFISALIHDSAGNPIDATNRHRHPTRRQRRLVKERDRVCVDCGRGELLEYDHVPAHQHTGRTLTTEVKLRCAPCHQQRHAPGVL